MKQSHSSIDPAFVDWQI